MVRLGKKRGSCLWNLFVEDVKKWKILVCDFKIYFTKKITDWNM